MLFLQWSMALISGLSNNRENEGNQIKLHNCHLVKKNTLFLPKKEIFPFYLDSNRNIKEMYGRILSALTGRT